MIDYNPYSLKGKTILILGASSGIGRSCSEEAIKLGATVILVARRLNLLQEIIEPYPTGNHQVYGVDVCNEEALYELIQQIPAIDGLVNTIGISDFVPLKFLKSETTKHTFQTNVFAFIQVLQLLVKSKKLNNYASCVVTASIAGNQSSAVGLSIYSSTKAALVGFMKSAALELAPQKIRVNAVCPGMIETDLIRRGKLNHEQYDKDMLDYPLKRYGKPEEVAWAIMFLLSNASSWTTGTCHVIDGGFTLR